MTTATQPDVVDDELVDENSTRKQRREADVQARTEKLLKEETAAAMKRQSKDAKAAKKRGENFNPLTETAMRTSLEGEVAKRAKREVHAEYRKQWAVEHAKAAGRSVKSDVITAVYRNRKQLAPWAMAAPFAVCGALGAGWGVTVPVAPAAVMTAVAGGGAWWLWTRGAGKRLAPVRDRVPARFHQRAKLGGLLGLLFVALASLITWSTPNIGAAWFILVAGTAVLALPWWKNVEHTIPPKPDEDTREPEPEPESEPEPDQLDAQHQRIMGILTAWENRVATSVVPGSTITAHEQNAAVESYRIVLDSDRDMVADEVSGHIKKIAMKLGVMQDKLSFEPDEVNPAVVWMRHVVATPSYDYTGPIVYANGKIVHSRWEVPYAAHIQIVVGHFVDGTGHAVYDLGGAAGVMSGYVLAGTGGGKSVLLNVLAVALRMLGVYIIYADGQNGSSSPTLKRAADEFYTSSPDDVATLWARMSAFLDERSRELSEDTELARQLDGQYHYDPHRPPLMVIIDECHRIATMRFPGPIDENGKEGPREYEKYGNALGFWASESRKTGGALVLADQDIDLHDTLGGSERLRSATSGSQNLFTLRFTPKTRGGMLPNGTPNLGALPFGGFGYRPGADDRPSAMYRVPSLVYTPEDPRDPYGPGGPDRDAGQDYPEVWMSRYEPAELDNRTAAAMDVASVGNIVAPAGGQQTEPQLFAVPDATPMHLFDDGDELADDVEDTGPTDADIQAAQVLEREPVSESERALLDALGWDGKEHTASLVADLLGISRQAATKRLQAAAKRGLVAKTENGKWINRKKENEV